MDRFIIVDSHNSEYIGIIFHILRKCGYNMALTKRLFHWIPSYSKRNIRRDCQTKTVVLVWNEELMIIQVHFKCTKIVIVVFI